MATDPLVIIMIACGRWCMMCIMMLACSNDAHDGVRTCVVCIVMAVVQVTSVCCACTIAMHDDSDECNMCVYV